MPAFRRADVTREADLIEEVSRLGALEILPATLPSRHGASGRLTAAQRLRRRAVDALTGRGLHEVVGWSFASAELARRLRIAERPAVALANPMSAEQARLRTTLIGSLLDVAQRNHARGASRLALCEAGAVYLPRGGAARPDEPLHLAALLSGPVRAPTWREPEPPAADFYAVKGLLGAVLDAIRVPWSLRADDPEPFLHPGPRRAHSRGRRTVRLDRGDSSAGRGRVGPRRSAGRVRTRPRRGHRPRRADALRRRDQLPRDPGGPRGDRRRHRDRR